jgi:hypothetical protein
MNKDTQLTAHLGKWAVSGAGQIGRIEYAKYVEGQWYAEGTALDGGPWRSIAPLILSDLAQTMMPRLLS